MGKYDNISKKRNENIKIFEDTMIMNTNHPQLKKSISESIANTEIIDKIEDFAFSKTLLGENIKKYGNINVVKSTTIDSLLSLKGELEDGDKVCILNFASATTVGGGVTKGSNAQEESICRVSTLYPVLNQEKVHNKYYSKNRLCGTRLYTNTCVYTPNIIIFKRDKEFLPEMDWMTCDVITCPAPNLRQEKYNRFNEHDNEGIVEYDKNKVRKTIEDRIELIINTAMRHNVTHLILGAFGCGAFKNPPEIVSDEFYNQLIKKFSAMTFKNIIFAIPYTTYSKHNYDVFAEKFTFSNIKREFNTEEFDKMKEMLNGFF